MTNTAATLTDTAAYLLDVLAALPTAEWIAVLDARTESGLTEDDADAALIELHRAGLITLETDPVAYARSYAYRAAAVGLGGEARHLIAIR